MGLLRAGHGRSFRPAAARTRARASLPHLGLPRRSGGLRDLGGAFSCQHVCGAALRSAVVPCADGQWRPGVPSVATLAPQVVELTSQPFLEVQCTRRCGEIWEQTGSDLTRVSENLVCKWAHIIFAI